MNELQASYTSRILDLEPAEAVRAFDRVARAAGLADGPLSLEPPGSPIPPDGVHYWPLRTMTGRLRLGFLRSVPVELALLPWSAERTELSIPPTTRNTPRGSAYGRVAGDVVERISGAIAAPATGRPPADAETGAEASAA